MQRRSAIILLLLVAMVAADPAPAAEIRLARQFSMGYLQLNAMENQKLIEKHARALGVPDVKVSWVTFNGPGAMNEALLSGSIDIATGGTPGLLILWDRTKGTAQEVRGISALSSQPFLLNTREPRITSLKDVKESDRIAVPAVKVSIQAIMLQMAAAKTFGASSFAKFDPLTVSMTPPDATIALLSGGGEINMVFSVPPFQHQQLEKAGVTTVLNSYDVMDGPHTFTVAWTSARFRDKNPELYKALLAALEEATELVNRDKRAAAALWIADSQSKLPLDFVDRIVSGPQVRWTLVPENTMKFARFMHSVGTLRSAPASWRDYFFPDIHDRDGS
jgi:NitT/TauT family transport system substrate-binding protein